MTPSTALVPYVSSASYRSPCPDSLQAYAFKKSFLAQRADHHYFYRQGIDDLLSRLSLPIQPFAHPLSLDDAIEKARNLAHTHLFVQALKGRLSPSSRGLSSADLQTTFFLDQTIVLIDASSPGSIHERGKELTHLFFDILPPCSYDHSSITPGGALESILDDRVYRAHHQPDEIDLITGQRIRETVAEALFARRLGVRLEKAYSEYHTVYYFSDRSGKRLGVFKPPICVDASEDRYGSSEDREAHLAEAASFAVDRFLGTKVAPYTQLVTCTLSPSKGAVPVTGSFQFYVEGACDLDSQLEGENLFDPNHEELGVRLDTPANRELEFRNLEEFALFDLVTGNNDHHFKNILLKKVAGKVWDLVAIDNANSFPWCHHADLPPYKMRPNHWFKWSALPQAKVPFSDPLVERINGLDLDHLEEIVRGAFLSEEVPSSAEHIEGKIKALRERFDRVKLLANQKASLRAIAKEVLALTSL